MGLNQIFSHILVLTAFVIKMPIMHRLACLRDDAIFLVFCYQRWKYKTDFSRVNEFGQCENPSEEMMEELKAHRDEVDDNETEIRTNKNGEGISQEEGQEVKKRRGARERRLTK